MIQKMLHVTLGGGRRPEPLSAERVLTTLADLGASVELVPPEAGGAPRLVLHVSSGTNPETARSMIQLHQRELQTFLQRETVQLAGCCCGCGSVRLYLDAKRPVGFEVVLLPFQMPLLHAEEEGWGCGHCRLALQGAYAFLCPRCIRSQQAILYAVVDPYSGRRVPLRELCVPWNHQEGCPNAVKPRP